MNICSKVKSEQNAVPVTGTRVAFANKLANGKDWYV